MSRNHENKPRKPLYVSLLQVFTNLIELSCFLTNPLFTGDCQDLQKVKKSALRTEKKRGAPC